MNRKDRIHLVARCLALLGAGAAAAGTAAETAALRAALVHHASFDEDFRADFSRGDPILYAYETQAERQAGGRPAQADDSLAIARGAGRHGGALLRDRNSPLRVFYRGAGIFRYTPGAWSGSVSVWLRVSPEEDLPPAYCDPVQIMGESTKLGYVFLEWSRDHVPRKFRYAILPRTELWNPRSGVWDEMTVAERPMVQVDRAPFSRAVWTHAVFTFDRLNQGRVGRGELYLNGRLQGAIEGWELNLGWNPDALQLVLAAGYVGLMDDLAVFDRALTPGEIRVLHELPEGIRSLAP